MIGGIILKRKIRGLISLLISACLLLSSCTNGNEQTTESAATTSAVSTSASSETEKTTLAALASEDEKIEEKEKTPLVVALGEYNNTCNPFYQTGDFDGFINEITGEKLLAKDRNGRIIHNGIDGERILYNGTYYEYSGIADVTESYNEETDETEYVFSLRRDVKFSDGEIMDADDLIFTLYMLLDPSMAYISDIQGIGIKGAVNYLLNSSIADTFSNEEIEEALQTEEVQKKIRDEIVMPVLKSEFEWVKSLYDDSSFSIYTESYPEPKDLMTFFYTVDSEYNSAEVADEQTVLSDLADMYGGNYELLGSMSEGDSAFYRTDAVVCAIEYLSEQSGESSAVYSIAGIEKTGKYSVKITVSGSNPSVIYELADITVAPLHYYGDESSFDADAEKFGFEKGTALELIAEKENAPLGAGPYYYERSESGVVYLTANTEYYKGTPLTEKIEVKQTITDSAVSAVSDGTADITYPDGSLRTSDEINSANEAMEKLFAATISKDGYGYIGINSANVNIGGNPSSEESIALRKALATAIYLYRDISVERYYGTVGIKTDYPAVLSAWIGNDYEKPYSKDINGTAIYIDGMRDQEKSAAAKRACLGYLEAAGYVVEDGKAVSAPEGGSLSFNAVIAADGTGNHPCYYALESAAMLLSDIGITLTITDTADASQMWTVMNSGTHQIWAAVWETGVQPRLSTMYSDDNYYGIDNEELDGYIAVSASSKDNEELKEAYTSCLNLIFGNAIEIPVYQRSDCVLFSTLRINCDTLPDDMTGYYSWVDEAHLIEKK